VIPLREVCILKNYPVPDLLRQTPGHRGIWGDIQFSVDRCKSGDYVVVLNNPPEDLEVSCPPQHIWAIIQEPPDEHSGPIHRGDLGFARVYTTDPTLSGKRYHHSQPALPWFIDRDYDYLKRCAAPQKTRSLSWVTSSKTVFRGHRLRMRFLKKIQAGLDFDLFGIGFQPLKDKWDGLASYRYSLAVENFSNPLYWSEKLSDCFLAWTMPIYYGCSRITDFFPADSLIQIDIESPTCVDQVREAVSSAAWERSLDAIATARELVLDRYQLFPFLAQEINTHEFKHPWEPHGPEKIMLPKEPRPPMKLRDRMRQFWRRNTSVAVRRSLAKIRQLFE